MKQGNAGRWGILKPFVFMAAYFFFYGPAFGGSVRQHERLYGYSALRAVGTAKIFFYAPRRNDHFRPKGRQVSTNIGKLYRLAKVHLSG